MLSEEHIPSRRILWDFKRHVAPRLISYVVTTPPLVLDEKINMKLSDEISLICVNTILQLKSGIVLGLN
jgi:hypothetical protein